MLQIMPRQRTSPGHGSRANGHMASTAAAAPIWPGLNAAARTSLVRLAARTQTTVNTARKSIASACPTASHTHGSSAAAIYTLARSAARPAISASSAAATTANAYHTARMRRSGHAQASTSLVSNAARAGTAARQSIRRRPSVSQSTRDGRAHSNSNSSLPTVAAAPTRLGSNAEGLAGMESAAAHPDTRARSVLGSFRSAYRTDGTLADDSSGRRQHRIARRQLRAPCLASNLIAISLPCRPIAMGQEVAATRSLASCAT
mmetsp:Transcript_39631/g.104609  ORF Transcript_39631/g.104609 Transcript_39631/m.104609 type:complete len:261 (-) Transcript_39631:399-1181(-)